MTAYNTLREANRARAEIWGKGNIDLHWRLNELAGEVGETCNLLKKIERERLGEPGSRTDGDALGSELADVLICLDLAMMKLEEIAQESLESSASWPNTIPKAMWGNGKDCANEFGIGLFLVTASFITWQMPHVSEEYGPDSIVLAPLQERIYQAKKWAAAITEWVLKINDIFCPKAMYVYVQDTFNNKSKQVGIDVYLTEGFR